MRVTTYIATSLEDIFKKFSYTIESDKVKSVTCIAYEGVVSDEIMAVYRIYTEGQAPRFFGVSIYDHDDGDTEKTIKAMKAWSKATDAKLLDRTGVDFLFELVEPFGVSTPRGRT